MLEGNGRLEIKLLALKTFNKKNKKMGFIMLEEVVGRGVGRTVGGGTHIRITYPFRVSQPRIVESTPRVVLLLKGTELIESDLS